MRRVRQNAFPVALHAHLTIACFHRLVDWLITTQIAVLLDDRQFGLCNLLIEARD